MGREWSEASLDIPLDLAKTLHESVLADLRAQARGDAIYEIKEPAPKDFWGSNVDN